MSSGINLSVQTPSTGTNYAVFDSNVCSQVTIVNDTGTDIEWRQDGAGIALPIPDGAGFTIFGVDNTNRISVRRKDTSNTQVTVKARAEA